MCYAMFYIAAIEDSKNLLIYSDFSMEISVFVLKPTLDNHVKSTQNTKLHGYKRLLKYLYLNYYFNIVYQILRFKKNLFFKEKKEIF